MDSWDGPTNRLLEPSLCHSLAGLFEGLQDECWDEAVDGGPVVVPAPVLCPLCLLGMFRRLDEPRLGFGIAACA